MGLRGVSGGEGFVGKSRVDHKRAVSPDAEAAFTLLQTSNSAPAETKIALPTAGLLILRLMNHFSVLAIYSLVSANGAFTSVTTTLSEHTASLQPTSLSCGDHHLVSAASEAPSTLAASAPR